MKPDEKVSSAGTNCASEIHQCVDSSHETTSNPPGPHESFSIFADTACGEPLCAQHLKLDFTPIEELDNDFVQRKCCAFWDFLNSRTDLHNLMVLPEENIYDINQTTGSEPSLSIKGPVIQPEPSLKETTAVSMLEFVEEKGLIDRTFEAKLPQSMCSLGSREYRENEVASRLKPTPQSKEVCRCSGVCKSCKGRPAPSVPLPESSAEVQLMCRKMTQWDNMHPKSMDPPGHPPPLSRCVMQRNHPT